MHLRQRNIKAELLVSGMNKHEMEVVLNNSVWGKVKLLYVSPERLQTRQFLEHYKQMHVSLIAVDEAHCISQWGYDFRPSYLEIADIRHDLPNVPVLALTATATPAVVDDIQERLAFTEKRVFRMSFERNNLAYVVRQASDKRDELLHIISHVKGATIVYVRSRRRTKEVADLLVENGISATYYHAGLDTAEKDERQRNWQQDKTRVMVATNAFGMGIDKPDVRLVIHIDCPDSIEAYFQEAGRAGRDGQKAYAVLLYNDGDKRKLLKRIADTFPEKEYIRKVYDHLAFYYQVATGSGYNATFEFNIDDFCHKFRHFPIVVHSALKILNRAGYIDYIEEQENQARVMFTLSREQLYRLQQMEPNEDLIITTLLRNYGGLFVDYGFIDEALIAKETNMTKPQVYLTLKAMAAKRIISFIPQKHIPHIRYMQRREDSEHLMFPAIIYDDLRQRFSERIHAMIQYVETDNQCRSRQLLRYFGEENAHDCGMCDVCLNENRTLTNEEKAKEAQQQILDLLADRKRHHVTQLRQLPLPYEQIDTALEELMLEESVYLEDGYLTLP
jgi:ATP-dependent DNA helicase RecQ